MAKLTDLERRFLRYHGIPAREIARIEDISIGRVLEVWAALKDRGAIAHTTGVSQGPVCEQLSFDQIDRLMRGNRAPLELRNHEIGWTTDTESSW